MAACLEGNHTLVRLTVDLRGTRARDLAEKYLMRNSEELRSRLALGPGVGLALALALTLAPALALTLT